MTLQPGKLKNPFGGHLLLPSENKYCIIGDLHGRIDTLERIVERSPGYHYVIIGDSIHHKPFFKRSRKTSPVRMLQYIREKNLRGEMTLLLGNNENYILENLVIPEKDILKKETRYTLQCLKELDFNSRIDLISWLARCPLTATIQTDSKRYRLGHALFCEEITKVNRSQILCGPGFPWWKDKLERYCAYEDDIYILGHYGYPYIRKNLRIIDATNFEGIGIFYVDREEFLIHY